MCLRQDEHTYYIKQCLDGTCNICGGLSLWSECIHDNEYHPLGKRIVDRHNFAYEIYQLQDGKESRKIKLVTSQVTISPSNFH